MFDLKGRDTRESRVAQALLESSWIKTKKLRCIVYRRDPLDNYQFIVALTGLDEEEPMFGPMVWDDARRKRPKKTKEGETEENRLGFKRREGISWHRQFPRPNEEETDWVIHLNGTEEDPEDELAQKFEDELLPPLRDLLERNNNNPLFPRLWYEERLARDKMRDRFRHLQPNARLDVVAHALKTSLHVMMARNLAKNENFIGIYLNTDKSWDLVGGFPEPQRIPETVEGNNGIATTVKDLEPKQLDDLNAFAWVDLSTRPILIKPHMSKVWQKRTRACGADLANAIHDKNFAGLCIVPLLDLNRPQRSMGVILLVSIGRQEEVCPAHLFLLSRMGWPTSGYLTPLLPIPGYPRWPDLDLYCGKDGGSEGEGKRIPRHVKDLACEFMPPGSEITIKELSSGHSGAKVFRLGVKSRDRVLEIPRVLKVGPVQVITKELSAYYRHVHNKAVGGAARVEAAAVRVFREIKEQRLEEDEYGAIAYTMVGAGQTAEPWSTWAKELDDLKILEEALKSLKKQLAFWYGTQEPKEGTAIDLLITRPFIEPLGKFKPKLQGLTNPDENEVREQLTSLSKLRLKKLGLHTSTCTIHGDLHTNNVFSVLQEDRAEPQSISLIDWGAAKNHAHPLTDIARLMTDLRYRVLWQDPKLEDPRLAKKWAFNIVKSWGNDNIGSAEDTDRECNWRLALIHQISKMLFWRDDSKSEDPLFPTEARQAAWQDLQDMVEWIEQQV